MKWQIQSSNVLVAYINWNDGEPNHVHENEDCVELKGSVGYTWNDEPCDRLKMSVCEKKGWNFTFICQNYLIHKMLIK